MKKPWVVRLIEAIFKIKIFFTFTLIIACFIFLYIEGDPNGVYFNFKDGFLSSLGYSEANFNGNAVARLSGIQMPFMVIWYLNLIAIKRRKKTLLTITAILNIMFSLTSALSLILSIGILIIILTSKDFKAYLRNSNDITIGIEKTDIDTKL